VATLREGEFHGCGKGFPPELGYARNSLAGTRASKILVPACGLLYDEQVSEQIRNSRSRENQE
jgi:hypothetical protein